jgi:outer membrane beta-barrel protein
MESRVLVLFLTLTLVVGTLTGCGRDQLVRTDDGAQPPVIEPDVERIFLGQISVEDFGVNPVAGARLAYHVTEGFFVELAAGEADTELTSFERLSGAAQLLTDEQRQYSYYNVSVGYNILPGEAFVGGKRALNTATYLIGGVGKTTFAGDDRFTLNLGIGIRLMPLDWLAVFAITFSTSICSARRKRPTTSRRTWASRSSSRRFRRQACCELFPFW